MPFDFLGRIDALNPANLTIREQTRLALNPNELRWRGIFPRVEAASIKISELEAPEPRFAGGRREWNAQGREIPDVLGELISATMIPINPTKHFDEEYLQLLRERAGNQLVTQGVVKDVDAWATSLANHADIQVERDAFEAWFYGQITVKDTKTGETQTVSLGIDAARYVAAGTTLAAATNAYEDFRGYARDARSMLGSLGAVRLRSGRMDEIIADAPDTALTTLQYADAGTVRMSVIGVGTITMVPDDRTYLDFTDGGSEYGEEFFVPADRMAFQPASGAVGATHFAPVTRAYDYMAPQKIQTVNDFVVFYDELNQGKTLLEEAQANALSVPSPSNVYVVTGIA